MDTRAYIALGANLGDRLGTLRSALSAIAEIGQVQAVSDVWETMPVGRLDQPLFLNAVVAIDTPLTPKALLDALLAIEQRLGRVRDPALRWGPRTVDLDLLLHGSTITADGVDVPHPRMLERAFVMLPLGQIAPGLRHPVSGRSIESHALEFDTDGLEVVVAGTEFASIQGIRREGAR